MTFTSFIVVTVILRLCSDVRSFDPCVPTNSPAVKKLVGSLPTTKVITFDDLGLQEPWKGTAHLPLPLSGPPQYVTLIQLADGGQSLCTVTNKPELWNSSDFWAGSTSEKPGYVLQGADLCTITLNPPISAFVARVNYQYQNPNVPFVRIYDDKRNPIECQALQYTSGVNGYVEIGFASATPISYIYFFNSGFFYLVDNIAILTCDKGLGWNGTQCTEIDMCVGNPCFEHSTCLNTNGSFVCICNEGYENNSNRTCVDIEECTTLSPCSSFATCTNINGSFTCSCNEGYEGDGLGQNGCQAIQTPTNNGSPFSSISPDSNNPPTNNIPWSNSSPSSSNSPTINQPSNDNPNSPAAAGRGPSSSITSLANIYVTSCGVESMIILLLTIALVI